MREKAELEIANVREELRLCREAEALNSSRQLAKEEDRDAAALLLDKISEDKLFHMKSALMAKEDDLKEMRRKMFLQKSAMASQISDLQEAARAREQYMEENMSSTISQIQDNLTSRLSQKSLALASLREELDAAEAEKYVLSDQALPRLKRSIAIRESELSEEHDKRLAAEEEVKILSSRVSAEARANALVLESEQKLTQQLQKYLKVEKEERDKAEKKCQELRAEAAQLRSVLSKSENNLELTDNELIRVAREREELMKQLNEKNDAHRLASDKDALELRQAQEETKKLKDELKIKLAEFDEERCEFERENTGLLETISNLSKSIKTARQKYAAIEQAFIAARREVQFWTRDSVGDLRGLLDYKGSEFLIESISSELHGDGLAGPKSANGSNDEMDEKCLVPSPPPSESIDGDSYDPQNGDSDENNTEENLNSQPAHGTSLVTPKKNHIKSPSEHFVSDYRGILPDPLHSLLSDIRELRSADHQIYGAEIKRLQTKHAKELSIVHTSCTSATQELKRLQASERGLREEQNTVLANREAAHSAAIKLHKETLLMKEKEIAKLEARFEEIRVLREAEWATYTKSQISKNATLELELSRSQSACEKLQDEIDMERKEKESLQERVAQLELQVDRVSTEAKALKETLSTANEMAIEKGKASDSELATALEQISKLNETVRRYKMDAELADRDLQQLVAETKKTVEAARARASEVASNASEEIAAYAQKMKLQTTRHSAEYETVAKQLMEYRIKDTESRKLCTQLEGELAELTIRLKSRSEELVSEKARAKKLDEDYQKRELQWNSKWSKAVELEEANAKLSRKITELNRRLKNDGKKSALDSTVKNTNTQALLVPALNESLDEAQNQHKKVQDAKTISEKRETRVEWQHKHESDDKTPDLETQSGIVVPHIVEEKSNSQPKQLASNYVALLTRRKRETTVMRMSRKWKNNRKAGEDISSQDSLRASNESV